MMWINPNFHDNAVRTELHLSGTEKTTKYLHDMIMKIEMPFDSYDEMDGYVFVYTSPDIAQKVFTKLSEQLYHRHPELIGHPDGVSIEDEVLSFKGCETTVHS